MISTPSMKIYDMMISNMDSFARIIDLGEATALLTLGFNLIRLEQSLSGKHKVFLFELEHPDEDSEIGDTNDIIQSYNRRKLQVDAYSFFRAGKELKNKIHEHNEILG